MKYPLYFLDRRCTYLLINKRILICFAIFSSILLSAGCSNNQNTPIETKNDNDIIAETKQNEIAVSYLMSQNDETVMQYETISDIEINRPSFLNYTTVFTGWNEEDTVSEIMNNSVEDDSEISLTLNTVDISDEINVIYNDAVYTDSTAEYIVVPVKIGGKVNFGVMDLEIIYDSELLEFDSFEYSDADAVCNKSENGKIIISFVSTSNVSSELDLCHIKFKKIKNGRNDTQLEYNINDIASWNGDFTGYTGEKHSFVNGKISMY